MSEKTRAELKEQIKIMNHNYQVIKEMHEKGYQYSVSEIKRLQDELDCTRKALDITVSQLKKTSDYIEDCRYQETNYFLVDSKDVSIILDETNDALEQITALEQKDK